MEAIRIQLERLGYKVSTCQWCGIYHPVKQCLNPKNASKRGPARLGAYEILEANQLAREGLVIPPRRVAID